MSEPRHRLRFETAETAVMIDNYRYKAYSATATRLVAAYSLGSIVMASGRYHGRGDRTYLPPMRVATQRLSRLSFHQHPYDVFWEPIHAE